MVKILFLVRPCLHARPSERGVTLGNINTRIRYPLRRKFVAGALAPVVT
jgi:hypothetical protein